MIARYLSLKRFVFLLLHTLSLLCTYIVAGDYQDDECAILFLNINKDSVKSISAFYAVFPPL
mgnify:CR=1 FL=1